MNDKYLNNNCSFEFSINATAKVMELFAEHGDSHTLDIEWTEDVQIRKHRKKRINKKWLKRYGTKQITKRLNNCSFNFDHDRIEVVSNNVLQISKS